MGCLFFDRNLTGRQTQRVPTLQLRQARPAHSKPQRGDLRAGQPVTHRLLPKIEKRADCSVLSFQT